MTLRNIYESLLIELNKVQAPSIMISDFIYLFNKAVQAYVNERYNLFDANQQLTDDLRVLTLTRKYDSDDIGEATSGSYELKLPDDYLHILNCVCEFESTKTSVCADDRYVQYGANKLNTNQWPHVINNLYMAPSYKRPYYYIFNMTDPVKSGISDDVKSQITGSGAEQRYGNATIPVIQIKCGSQNRYKLHAVSIDYLRVPQYLAFDQSQLDDIDDTTQVVEFPDYVIYEIINKLVTQILENHQDPRIQTQPVVTKTIQ